MNYQMHLAIIVIIWQMDFLAFHFPVKYNLFCDLHELKESPHNLSRTYLIILPRDYLPDEAEFQIKFDVMEATSR